MLVKGRPKRRRHTTETKKVKKFVNISTACFIFCLVKKKNYVLFIVCLFVCLMCFFVFASNLSSSGSSHVSPFTNKEQKKRLVGAVFDFFFPPQMLSYSSRL